MQIEEHTLVKNEEKGSLKLYLTLFYIISISYDLYWTFIYADSVIEKGLETPAVTSLWINVAMLLLIPIASYFWKKEKYFSIKYMYFVTYTALTIVNECFTYIDNPDLNYMSGNIVEVYWLIFAAIFVNKRFFITVVMGLILKYAFVGAVIQTGEVFVPIIVILILSLIIYMVLNFCTSYLKQLKESYVELQQTENLALIGEMATSVGQEVRVPLSSLKGFTQLQKENLSGDQEFLSIMLQEIDRITIISNDLLVMGNNTSFEMEKCNLNEIITYVLNTQRQYLSGSQINIITNLESNLPHVMCDKSKIIQVIMNLIKNGIEAMPEGGDLTISTESENEDTVIVSVKDTGFGMNDEQIESAGTSFYTTKREGTGLGLMVTRKILEAHQGTIKFTSVINKGTKVDVRLPITSKIDSMGNYNNE